MTFLKEALGDEFKDDIDEYYLDLDEIDEFINSELTEDEWSIVNRRFDLDGKGKKGTLRETAEELGITMGKAKINEIKAFHKMKQKTNLFHRRNQASTLEQLGFSVRVVTSLKKEMIYTLDDLRKTPKEEIEKMRGLGKKSINEIMSRINEKDSYQEAANRAYDYFMKEENIFDPEEIIPASIIEKAGKRKEDTLTDKRIEREKKKKTYNELQASVEEQDSKIVTLRRFLKEHGIKTPEDLEKETRE